MQQESIKIAEEIADEIGKSRLPEEYRGVAFRILLEYRLRVRPVATAPIETSTILEVVEEISFSEFLNQIGELRTNPQRFAAVARYYELHRKESSVTQEEIMNTITDAGLRAPANFSRDIRLATSTRNALLMPSRESKGGQPAWQLTRTGRQFVERLHTQRES